MLYVTTRSDRDAYTANRALREDRGPDGGLYLPFRHPKFSGEELTQLLDQSFGQCTAQVINCLFNTKLTDQDVEFALGKIPVSMVPLGHRLLSVNCWNKAAAGLEQMTEALGSLLCPEHGKTSGWTEIALRAAILFGVFSQLPRTEALEVACLAGNMITPMSVWYARQWGLPIGRIICCCNENNGIWELLSYGQLHTDAVSIPTSLPKADISLPVDLERLIYACGGLIETEKYLNTCRRGGLYCPSDKVLSALQKGMCASVVSSSRIDVVIPSVYRTWGILLAPMAALVYAGFMDYRAKTGVIADALLLSEENPEASSQRIARLLEIPNEEMKSLLR